MKDLIIKKFVSNYQDVKNPEVRERYGSIAGVVGIISNLVLCIFKIAVGLVFGSIAILSDGINNLADAGGSMITLIGFKLAGRKPDKDHPYGHGRTEYLTGLVVSVMVLAIGMALLKSSVEKTIHPEALEFSILSIIVLIVAIGIKIWQTSFNVSIGRIIESDALIATAADSRNDVISTTAVLLSVIIGRFFNVNIDGPIGILVALFIIRSGVELVRETIAPIIGKAPDEELIRSIEKIVMSDDCSLGIHDVIVHDYGPGRMFASLHIEVDGTKDIFDIHDRVDNLETRVFKELGVLLTIHMDPVDLHDPAVNKAKEALTELVGSIEGISGFHDVRAVSGPTHTNVVFDVVKEYSCELSDVQIREYFDNGLKKYDDRFVAVINIDNKFA